MPYSQPAYKLTSETYFYTGEIRGRQILVSGAEEDKSHSGSLQPENQEQNVGRVIELAVLLPWRVSWLCGILRVSIFFFNTTQQ